MSQAKPEKIITRQENGLFSTAPPPERALLGQFIGEKPAQNLKGASAQAQAPDEEIDSLEELAGLAEAAGALVVGEVTQKRAHFEPATLFGKGKVEEIAQIVEDEAIEVFIVDRDLTPAQGRNLENALKCRVIDRTELILDIFARRAQTKQAKLQVELAQLRYQLPRLKRMWSHLERQGGGIGMRGPGETQLETDKRLARDRISLLEKQLEKIRRPKDKSNRPGARNSIWARSSATPTSAKARCSMRFRGPTGQRRSGSQYAVRHAGRDDAQSRTWAADAQILLSDTVGSGAALAASSGGKFSLDFGRSEKRRLFAVDGERRRCGTRRQIARGARGFGRIRSFEQAAFVGFEPVRLDLQPSAATNWSAFIPTRFSLRR